MRKSKNRPRTTVSTPSGRDATSVRRVRDYVARLRKGEHVPTLETDEIELLEWFQLNEQLDEDLRLDPGFGPLYEVLRKTEPDLVRLLRTPFEVFDGRGYPLET